MTSIVMLTPDEKFLQFLDPDLCDIKETITTGGLRTITLDYKFQTYEDDKQLFQLGNKLWVSGDVNLSDALYVVNTSVKQDIFKDNSLICPYCSDNNLFSYRSDNLHSYGYKPNPHFNKFDNDTFKLVTV